MFSAMCKCHIYQSHHTTVFQKKKLTNFVENIIYKYRNFALFLLLVWFFFMFVCLSKTNEHIKKKKGKI